MTRTDDLQADEREKHFFNLHECLELQAHYYPLLPKGKYLKGHSSRTLVGSRTHNSRSNQIFDDGFH